jgi:hypothetical protein
MRRWLTATLAAIAALLVFVAPVSAVCIKRHGIPIASGPSPSGGSWTVEGRVGNNGSCHEWLLGMDFALPGAAYWGWGTGIPAGGHLTKNFTIEASDDLQEDGSQRVFSGAVGGEVAKVVATLSNGKRLSIEPRSAPAKLRRHVVWLRNVRYFVQYYLPEGFVTSASLLSSSGRLLYRATGMGGQF